jgi:hypothetical protein
VICTKVAWTVVVPLWVAVTVTWSPDWTVADLVRRSLYLVEPVTVTVTVVPLRMGMVELVPVRVKPVEEGRGVVATVPLTSAAGMRTDLASMVPVPAPLPETTTCSPARTSFAPGEVTPGSL